MSTIHYFKEERERERGGGKPGSVTRPLENTHSFEHIQQLTNVRQFQVDFFDKAIRFDTKSYTIRINNHASKCISNKITHFIGSLTPTPNTVSFGTGENLEVTSMGTIRCRIKDDDGKMHTITLKDYLYVPGIFICFLSPQ